MRALLSPLKVSVVVGLLACCGFSVAAALDALTGLPLNYGLLLIPLIWGGVAALVSRLDGARAFAWGTRAGERVARSADGERRVEGMRRAVLRSALLLRPARAERRARAGRETINA